MKRFLEQLLILFLFILSALSFYVAIKVAFFSSFINILFIILAFFFLIIACGEMDKVHGFGQYSATTHSDSEQQENPSDTPNMDEHQHHQHHHHN